MRHMKLKFRVIDKEGNDITYKEEWYIDSEGYLFFMTDDIDCPLMEAESSYEGCKLEFYYE